MLSNEQNKKACSSIPFDEHALLVGDVLVTGFWATRISETTEDDTVLNIGAGPTGICTLLCVMLNRPKRIIVCEKSEERRRFVQEHYPEVLLTTPEECKDFVLMNSDHGGADRVLEVVGAELYGYHIGDKKQELLIVSPVFFYY